MIRCKQNQLVVLAVSYDGVKKYLDDYFASLDNQTVSNFDVLIANDGLFGLELFLEKFNLNWLSFDVSGSVSSNRQRLIQKALDMKYEKIVFTDMDDTFHDNRLEISMNVLEDSSVMVNDLNLIDVDGRVTAKNYFSRRFKQLDITLDTLFYGNMMGMSNTSARSEVFKDSPAITGGESNAFDWYLWTTVLAGGDNALFTSETSTNYRIHDNNIAGLPQNINLENVIKGVEIKYQHYNLVSYLGESYIKQAEGYKILKDMIKEKDWREQYIYALNAHPVENATWWENIRLPFEVGL